MAYVYFPAELGAFDIEGFAESRGIKFRTNSETADLLVSKERVQGAKSQFTITVTYCRDKLQTFKQFYQNDLKYGSQKFYANLIVGNEMKEALVQIVSDLSTSIGPNNTVDFGFTIKVIYYTADIA